MGLSVLADVVASPTCPGWLLPLRPSACAGPESRRPRAEPISWSPLDPAWASLKDEELLAVRICDLRVRIEGSELEPRVAKLHAELGERGLGLRPPCYLGDEWFTPAGVPAIAIPFYLAHPRLKQLELHQ